MAWHFRSTSSAFAYSPFRMWSAPRSFRAQKWSGFVSRVRASQWSTAFAFLSGSARFRNCARP